MGSKVDPTGHLPIPALSRAPQQRVNMSSVAWVVVTERVNFKQANGQQHDLTITATNIFEKIGDRWLMTQHQPTPLQK